MYVTESGAPYAGPAYGFAFGGTPAPSPATPVPTPPPGCDQAQLERLVNACIDHTRRCVFAGCTRKMAAGLARCRGKPWCNVRVAAKYHRCLGSCRKRLLECDQRAKRTSGCRVA